MGDELRRVFEKQQAKRWGIAATGARERVQQLARLRGAIAAGNTAVLKPSEKTANTARVMRELIAATFDESEVALVEGGPETAAALLELPFDHIFFTGSTRIGHVVMAAAAKHLATVTL